MREATGSSMLLYIVVVIVGIIILLFVTIISYAKAYGAKDKIITALETHEEYVNEKNNPAKLEIDENLRQMGYTITHNDYCSNQRVKNHLKEIGLSGATNLNDSTSGHYNYCIYKVNTIDSGYYYVVVTFISYNVPIVGNLLLFPVYGETKVIGRQFDY
jgi:cell division protein FtsL